jgi:hypothetical protein
MWIRILHLQLTILEALILKNFLDSNHLSSVHHRRLLTIEQKWQENTPAQTGGTPNASPKPAQRDTTDDDEKFPKFLKRATWALQVRKGWGERDLEDDAEWTIADQFLIRQLNLSIAHFALHIVAVGSATFYQNSSTRRPPKRRPKKNFELKQKNI